MLTKINKIKELGVFDNYASAVGFAPFGRYNVIYGENGSGKTTLSRLLACLGDGAHADYPALEYAVDCDTGVFTHGMKYARGVRVFNSDFVEANIGRFDGPLRHILILGEENKAIAEELKTEIATRDGRNAKIQLNSTAFAKLRSDRDKLFSQIAKTIGEATSGTTLRSYRKPDAEKAYLSLPKTIPESADDLETHRATVRQEQMPAITPLEVPTDIGEVGMGPLEVAQNAALRAKLLIGRSAQAAVIERLAKNPLIAEWVENGVHIHKDSPERCEFCDQPIPAQRLKLLAEHFSVEDQLLKDELETERSRLTDTLTSIEELSLPDRLALYSELRPDYATAVEAYQVEISKLTGQLKKIQEAITHKITMRTTSYEVELLSDTAGFAFALTQIQNIIERHNQKTTDFENAKSKARAAIESYYLQSIRAQVGDLDKQAEIIQAENLQLNAGGEGLPDKRSLEELSASISAKQAQVSSAHAGGKGLTTHLKQFLGRTDLEFESSAEGYRILRRGKAAKRLSEGEKTAIAFLYFLVQLKDQNFTLSDGVVVIDDPISSLDASAIYQAFSFLKNETQNAGQLFILTHNFEFLRLLINWINGIPGGAKLGRTYNMVLCSETENGRSARLAPLDKLLIEHATEYHYLFKVLYTFKSDGTISSCYHIPNIARKVLETFLDFHIPSKKDLYRKLVDVTFDEHKKTAIYKFANDLSHHTGKSFDPALVAETQKNTEYLLEMIKTVAPLHYSGLEALSQ